MQSQVITKVKPEHEDSTDAIITVITKNDNDKGTYHVQCSECNVRPIVFNNQKKVAKFIAMHNPYRKCPICKNIIKAKSMGTHIQRHKKLLLKVIC